MTCEIRRPALLDALYDLLIGDYRTLVGVVLSGLAAYALVMLEMRLLAAAALVVGAGLTLAYATHAKAG